MKKTKSIIFSLFYVFLFICFLRQIKVKAYFIRGAIYEKKDQHIVLLGDLHIKIQNPEINLLQAEDAIKNLKTYGHKNVLAIIEDMLDQKAVNNIFPEKQKLLGNYFNKEKIVAIEKRLLILNNACREYNPMSQINNIFREKKIKTVNVECRLAQIAFLDGCLSIPPGCMLYEIMQNKKRLKKYIEYVEKLSFINKETKKNILDFYKKRLICFVDSTGKYIKLLKKYDTKKTNILFSLPPVIKKDVIMGSVLKKMYSEKEKIDSKVYYGIKENITHNVPLLDASIVHNIVANSNKKIVVVAAGVDHIVQVEALLEKIDYKLKKEAGTPKTKSINYLFQMNSLPYPIDVKNIFANVKKLQKK